MKKSIDLSLWLQQGLEFYKAGKFKEAEALFRKALEVKPDYGQAWYFLGLLKQKQGRLDKAQNSFEKAVEASPNVPDFKIKLATFFVAKGEQEKGKALLNEVSEEGLTTTQSQIAMGNAFRTTTDWAKAEHYFRKALQTEPNHPSALNHLGNTMSQQGKHEEAKQFYQQLISLKPQLPQPYLNLGVLHGMLQNTDLAMQYFQQALALKPDWAEPYEKVIQLLISQRDWSKALTVAQKAISVHADYLPFYEHLSTIYGNLKNYKLVAKIAKHILSKAPDHPEANYQMGVVLAENGRTQEGIPYFEKAAETAKAPMQAQFYLAKAYRDLGNYQTSLATFQKVVEENPQFYGAKHELDLLNCMLCNWEAIDKDRITEGIQMQVSQEVAGGFIPVLSLNYFGVDAATRLMAAKHTSLHLNKQVEKAKQELNFTFEGRKVKDKIRLGYYSPDFRSHAVGSLIKDMFGWHDKSRFEIYAYSLTNPLEDAIHEKIKSDVDKFYDVSNQSYTKIAQQVYADEIDILIDLGGYTTYTKTEVMALRPAPIQVQYIGLLDTMGADFIDYTIADNFAITPKQTQFYTEKVKNLSQAFITTQLEVSDKPTNRKDWNLPEDAFVFASFNASYKINEVVFSSWMRILKAVPNSVLWLVQENELVIEKLRSTAEKLGVSADRIVFSNKVKLPIHLERSQLADLFLDTFCFNAGAVAVGALQVGLPILTLAGNSYASRIGGSLLQSVGLTELICYSETDYEKKAIALANLPGQLNTMRQKLMKQNGSLFDGIRKVKELEKLFEEMMEK